MAWEKLPSPPMEPRPSLVRPEPKAVVERSARPAGPAESQKLCPRRTPAAQWCWIQEEGETLVGRPERYGPVPVRHSVAPTPPRCSCSGLFSTLRTYGAEEAVNSD